MAWFYVLAAGLLEVIWAVGLKYTDGFTRFWPSAVTVVTFSGSLFLLALAVQSIPIGTAYAMFVGIGAVGAAVLGIILFGEPTDAAADLLPDPVDRLADRSPADQRAGVRLASRGRAPACPASNVTSLRMVSP